MPGRTRRADYAPPAPPALPDTVGAHVGPNGHTRAVVEIAAHIGADGPIAHRMATMPRSQSEEAAVEHACEIARRLMGRDTYDDLMRPLTRARPDSSHREPIPARAVRISRTHTAARCALLAEATRDALPQHQYDTLMAQWRHGRTAEPRDELRSWPCQVRHCTDVPAVGGYCWRHQ